MNDDKRSKGRVLIVDDDASVCEALQQMFVAEGYATSVCEDGAAALEVAKQVPHDVIVTDLQMPNLDGLGLLKAIRETDRNIPVIVVTAMDDVATAVEAMRLGAEDFLTKPIEFDALALVVERALQRREERSETENLRRQLRERDSEGLQGLLGASEPMQKVYRVAKQVAPSRATVLVTGESGTGKGELARALHALSPRAHKPFVSLHCAALAESLLESELFGHEKGSFTGADRKRLGRIEQADGGTLFLDEVGEIPLSTQVRLLRFLQERVFERVGGNETVSVDVRVIAATNRDLVQRVREGHFREDLYYRLNVVQIDMPPLRVRGGDIVALAKHFLRKFARENNKRIEDFTSKAQAKIASARWPGNVRALENAIERAVVLCTGDRVDEADLPFESAPDALGGLRIPGSTMAEVERYVILKTLEATEGSTAKAADILDIGVRTIQYRLHEYGLAKKS